MKKKLIARILQAPFVVLLSVVVFAIWYIKIFNPALFPMPISWGTPVLLLFILIFYFWGRYMETKASDNFNF